MKLGIGFAVVILLSAGVLYGQLSVPAGSASAPAPAVAPAPPVGRFQLTVVGTSPGNSEAWLIDTQTGDTWRRPTGGNWVFAGNPTQNPGPKTPAPRPPATAPQVFPER
jgi:hypothetical protein